MVAAHEDGRDELLVGTTWDLVDGTAVEARVFGTHLDGVHVDDRKKNVEHFRLRLNQASVTLVPTATIQVQTVNVYSLLRAIKTKSEGRKSDEKKWLGRQTNHRAVSDVFFEEFRHVVVKHNTVKRPTFVRTRHLLTHGRQKS